MIHVYVFCKSGAHKKALINIYIYIQRIYILYIGYICIGCINIYMAHMHTFTQVYIYTYYTNA